MNAGKLEYGAHRSARDNARSGRRGFHEDVRRADVLVDDVRNRALHHRYGDQILLGRFDRFANCFGNFAGLPDRESDLAFAVADDDERAETEALAALDDLRDAVDAHDRFIESAIVAVAAAAAILH